MPDLALLATVLTSIKTATDIAKGLREADLSLEKAETKLKLADLMSALADARTAVSSFKEELVNKDRQIKELQEILDARKAMKYVAPFYWREEAGQQRDGPFCQQCYDSKRSVIRVQSHPEGWWSCSTCGQSYNAGGQRSTPRVITEFDLGSP